ncbi:hypothetical protein ACQ29_gp378 [Escherichia phage PBECO4]|uniref:Uncharacterized protein n=1 Tax=Escherichia phage PBECO4 TaxID=1273738 RepID=L7TLP5_9CAUD|nr:hypothetical protein ACQ29_gp378 [Escherichia phage PBECO4]AGC35058.1 hypothetical protein [Escherichia phage PBECO4]
MFGRTLVLAIIHTPGIRNYVSYEFKKNYHNNTEVRTTKMCKDFKVDVPPFKKYEDE